MDKQQVTEVELCCDIVDILTVEVRSFVSKGEFSRARESTKEILIQGSLLLMAIAAAYAEAKGNEELGKPHCR